MYKIEKQDREVNVKDLFPELKRTRKEYTFFDEEGKIVEKEQARKVIIKEYNEDNQLIKETWGNLEPKKTK